MKDLIEALNILIKYGDNPFPTHCEHDTLYLFPAVPMSEVSSEDIARLDELGFSLNSDTGEGFYSFKYGSC